MRIEQVTRAVQKFAAIVTNPKTIKRMGDADVSWMIDFVPEDTQVMVKCGQVNRLPAFRGISDFARFNSQLCQPLVEEGLQGVAGAREKYEGTRTIGYLFHSAEDKAFLGKLLMDASARVPFQLLSEGRQIKPANVTFSIPSYEPAREEKVADAIGLNAYHAHTQLRLFAAELDRIQPADPSRIAQIELGGSALASFCRLRCMCFQSALLDTTHGESSSKWLIACSS